MRTKLCLSAGLAVLVLTAWTTDARAGDCDALKLCYKDSLGNGTGVPIKWNMSCAIKYKVNVTLLDAAARATAVQAVQKAFAAYELPCTELKFQYAGLSTSQSDEKDAILVVFGDNTKKKGSWIYGNAAYYSGMDYSSFQTGQITKAWLALNSGDYGWSVGPKEVSPPHSGSKSHIDVQTALMWMIPQALGFWVSKDFAKPELPINYNTQLSALCTENKTGAKYAYFKAGTGCTKPKTPDYCKKGGTPSDMGVTADGFFTDMGKTDCGTAPAVDMPKVTPTKEGGGPTTDSTPPKKCAQKEDCAADEICTVDNVCVKTGGGDDEDDGCCAVGRGRSAPGPLLLLAVLMLLRRRSISTLEG